ncbi:hypothetical protein GCM10010390_50000 [Streptomyces mordarskii]|uniref:DUF475 domain-containing protein n=1 Tax=Streptomyces mordarskii TaxID=1226758 RepID=A0ABN1DG33_9ACTN
MHTSAHTVLYDPDGLIEAELPLDREPYECLVKAVLAWTGEDTLTTRDYEQIALHLTSHARAVAADVRRRANQLPKSSGPRALADVVLREAEGRLSATPEGTVRCVQVRARLVPRSLRTPGGRARPGEGCTERRLNRWLDGCSQRGTGVTEGVDLSNRTPPVLEGQPWWASRSRARTPLSHAIAMGKRSASSPGGRRAAAVKETPNRLLIGMAGKAAFFMFLYLEVLDASFSFDGVIAAFAITNDIVLMSLGLGIGAMHVRSLTVYLVRQGTLDDYVYLEHGAHYAIGALAVILMISIRYQIPEVVTGLIGVVLIAWAFWSSVRRNRRLAADEGEQTAHEKAEVSSGVWAGQSARAGLDQAAQLSAGRSAPTHTKVLTLPPREFRRRR